MITYLFDSPGVTFAGRAGNMEHMKEIQLTQGKVSIVDDADYDFLSQFNWFVNHGYAVRMSHAKEGGRRRVIGMHRVVAKAQEGEEVDHINRNPLDNRRANLRTCEPCQNCWNKPVRPDSILGVKGVRIHQGKFQVRIKCRGVRVFRKEYDTLEEAKSARAAYAKIYHGDFTHN